MNASGFVPTPKNFNPALGLARMTDVVKRNEKCFWLLQVRVTPYNASKAGIKYEPMHWQGTPLIRVVWVNRDGKLAEYQEWLDDGEEVQIPSVWELSVEEVIYMADRHSALGAEGTAQWLAEAQQSSTLIEDVIRWEEQKGEMARNRSTFGPAQRVQRNGFPMQLRDAKFRESNRMWNQ